MFRDTPECKKPDGGDKTKIWRYMDLAKFVSLLDRESLFFCRVDGFPGDPFEGRYPKGNREWEYIPPEGVEVPDGYLAWLSDRRDGTICREEKGRKLIAVNCWNRSEYVVDAMFSKYINGEHGVVIQSTYGNLKRCFGLAGDMVYIGKVEYIDFEKEIIPFVAEDGAIRFSLVAPFMYKRHNFETDKELRALILKVPNPINTDPFCGAGGAYVHVDLEALIENIYVSPGTPDWFKDVVGAVLKRYHLYDQEVLRSVLDDKPGDI